MRYILVIAICSLSFLGCKKDKSGNSGPKAPPIPPDSYVVTYEFSLKDSIGYADLSKYVIQYLDSLGDTITIDSAHNSSLISSTHGLWRLRICDIKEQYHYVTVKGPYLSHDIELSLEHYRYTGMTVSVIFGNWQCSGTHHDTISDNTGVVNDSTMTLTVSVDLPPL